MQRHNTASILKMLSSLLRREEEGKENSPLLTAEYRIFPKKGKNAMCISQRYGILL